MADDWLIVGQTGISNKQDFLALVASGDLTHETMDGNGGADQGSPLSRSITQIKGTRKMVCVIGTSLYASATTTTTKMAISTASPKIFV